VKPCPEFDVLLTEDAAGALPPAEAARVGAHLVECPACRAERDALAAALGGAALPPVSELERRAMADLPASALAALRRTERRRVVGNRVILAAIGACAALLLAYWRMPAGRGGAEEAVAAAEPAAPSAATRPAVAPLTPTASPRTLSAAPEGRGVEGSPRTNADDLSDGAGGEGGQVDSAEPSEVAAAARAPSPAVAPLTPTLSPRAAADEQSDGAGGEGDQVDSAEPSEVASAPPADFDAAEPQVASRSPEVGAPARSIRDPLRGTIRLRPPSDVRSPTSNGFAPATAGERAAPRWQGPDLEVLWEDTAVLDLEGGLDL
jgi:hypothetical protein